MARGVLSCNKTLKIGSIEMQCNDKTTYTKREFTHFCLHKTDGPTQKTGFVMQNTLYKYRSISYYSFYAKIQNRKKG